MSERFRIRPKIVALTIMTAAPVMIYSIELIRKGYNDQMPLMAFLFGATLIYLWKNALKKNRSVPIPRPSGATCPMCGALMEAGTKACASCGDLPRNE